VRLVFANGPLARAGAGILMTAPSMRLGRGSGNDLIIEERSVSRAGHARVFKAYGGWFVEDLGSSGGTYLNEQEVTTPRELMPQDILRFGDVEARFEVVA
jgi:pSer/pThr/pTyr-binding forkhead associated (FHA) protein